MAAPEDTSSTVRPSWGHDFLLLGITFAVLFALTLGRAPLSNPDEGRNAEIPREMLATGDWVTPRLDGINYFEKPPLVYWCVATAEKALGRGEFVIRLTPALFALAGVLLTYAAARRWGGRDAGLASAIVLGTSLLYFAIGQFVVLDTAVSVLMSATLFCFLLAVCESPGRSRRWLFYGLYVSAALATLTKGMMGFLVTGAVMFVWLLVFNQWHRLRPMYLPTGVLLFLAIAVPWHVLAALRNPTWVHRYIVYEHFERYLTPAAGRVQPAWFFVPIVFLGLFPWMGFLWPALRQSVAGGWARRKENADAWFLVTWAAFIFLFFSASSSKLATYILPIFPALAVLIGTTLARLPADATRHRAGFRVFSFICGLLALALLVVVFRIGLVIRDTEQALALRPMAVVLALVLLAGGILAPWLAIVRGTRIGLGAIVATGVFLLVGAGWARTWIQKPGTKELAEFVRSAARPGDRVMHYFDYFHDFSYYAERTVELIAGEQNARKLEFSELELKEDKAAVARGMLLSEDQFRAAWQQPTRIFVVAKKKDVRQPRADGRPPLFEDPSFHYRLLGETRDHYLFSNRP